MVRVFVIVALIGTVMLSLAVGANICWSLGYCHGYRVRHAIAEEQLAEQHAADRKVNSMLVLVAASGKPGWIETSGGDCLVVPKAHQEWASKIVEGQTIPMPENWREWQREPNLSENLAMLLGSEPGKVTLKTAYFFAK
jgi:hypothetical protein